MAAALGIDAAPGYALGRTYDDFGFEFVAAKGNKAFEGEGDLWLRRPRLTWMQRPALPYSLPGQISSVPCCLPACFL